VLRQRPCRDLILNFDRVIVVHIGIYKADWNQQELQVMVIVLVEVNLRQEAVMIESPRDITCVGGPITVCYRP
jgi:hypothetical protein